VRRRHLVIGVAVAAALACGGTAIAIHSSAKPSACGDPHAHVYNPDRLQVLAPCVTVRGTIESIRFEPDGDDHIRLRVDQDQRDPNGGHYINPGNSVNQGGDLVLEPVCERQPTQRDAVATCSSYHNSLVIPPSGSHVIVTGAWVYDTNHGWNEIHPLVQVTIGR
jgi:hypothetical protein